MLEEKLELAPDDWLNWSDEDFNNWRREHDFPRIVDFLFKTLPFFSIWLSEQAGLTSQDLIFHGPARFIRLYGAPMRFVEHDISLRLNNNQLPQPILRHCFIRKDEEKTGKTRVVRSIEFSSYIDWAYKNRNWIFHKSPSSIDDFTRCLTPSGRSSNTSTYINSESIIQFNIPFFMPSVSIDEIYSTTKQGAPPSLKLLNLGGEGITFSDGFVGEKNLEFTNIDNITLINPIITSFQDISYSTLRNFKVYGQIHAAKFHQCSLEIDVTKGKLLECDFEYCESAISLSDSKLYRSSIREKHLRLKLKDTEVSDCCFEYLDMNGGFAAEGEIFNKSAKMIYSHLGYPDLAGKHFFLEQKEKRKGLWKFFSSLDRQRGLRRRILSLFHFIWMAFQEVYWGYGERPFNIILFSLASVIGFSLFGYFNGASSTAMDLGDSLIFAFQAFTNITIKDVTQERDAINLIGSFMSFFGVMSVGLLVAALSAKTKNYN